jgi:hypothetical protein
MIFQGAQTFGNVPDASPLQCTSDSIRERVNERAPETDSHGETDSSPADDDACTDGESVNVLVMEKAGW